MGGGVDSWRARIDAFWATADDDDPEVTIERMRALVAERGSDDPEALFEWASVHDFVGREREAVIHYRSAIEGGLRAPLLTQARIQLGSSLRNIGALEEAERVLSAVEPDDDLAPAAHAFHALTLHEQGREADALRAALGALAPTLPRYRRSVEEYAREITRSPAPERIRAIAVGLVVRDAQALVEIYPETARHGRFARALGGGIDFAETADEAVRREFREELGVSIADATLLAVIENIFDTGTKRGHEIVHVFSVRSPGLDALPPDAALRILDGHTTAEWRAIEDLLAGKPVFHPPGMAQLAASLSASGAADPVC